MELINYQKFVGVVVFGYFAIKIYYSLLFGDIYCKTKDSREEMVDLATTTVLATIIYIFTNLDIVVSNSFVFYIGFLIGTQVIFLKQSLFDSDIFKKKILFDNNISYNDVISTIVFVAYSLIFAYFYIFANMDSTIVNPLLIIISVISLSIGLLITRKKYNKDLVFSQPFQKYNFNIGFFSFMFALLFVHSTGENIIVSFFQSMLIGSFVSYFSYYGPEYLFDKVGHFPNNTVDLQKVLTTISDITPQDGTSAKDLLTKINANISQNIKELTIVLNNYNDNCVSQSYSVNEILARIKTNTIVSSLSYVTIIIVIILAYVYYGSDMKIKDLR
jgi:hypothetical protein